MFKVIQKKILLLIILIFIIGVDYSFGQRWKLLRYQVGGSVGTAQIFGDIGGTADENNWFGLKDIKFSETSLALGAYARYKINTFSSVKASLNYGRGKASDEGSRNNRGRSYKANFFEFSGQYEYYFLSEEPRRRSGAMFNQRGMINNYSTLSAYAFIGLGATYSSLKHSYDTIFYFDDYKETNIAPVIPLGLGVKFFVDERWFIGAELGYRWAINDYIEGYKQTESSKFNDVYYFLMFSANYKLKTSRRGIPVFMDRKAKKRGY